MMDFNDDAFGDAFEMYKPFLCLQRMNMVYVYLRTL